MDIRPYETYVNRDIIRPCFFGDEIGILSVDLNNINLGSVNFDKDYLKTINYVKTYGLG